MFTLTSTFTIDKNKTFSWSEPEIETLLTTIFKNTNGAIRQPSELQAYLMQQMILNQEREESFSDDICQVALSDDVHTLYKYIHTYNEPFEHTLSLSYSNTDPQFTYTITIVLEQDSRFVDSASIILNAINLIFETLYGNALLKIKNGDTA